MLRLDRFEFESALSSAYCPSPPCRVSPRRTRYFSLFRQRKVPKRKATLFVVPSLRCGHPCGARSKWGHAQTRFAQTSARPDPLCPALLGSSPRGLKTEAREGPEFFSYPVLAGPSSADGGGGSGQTCLSRRRVVWTAAVIEQRRLPEVKRRDPDCGSPSLCLLSLGEARESEAPAGARPGLVVKGITPNQQWLRQAQPER
jgi:hypothetical protein